MSKTYIATFKARVVSELLKDERTLAQCATRFAIHPNSALAVENHHRRRKFTSTCHIANDGEKDSRLVTVTIRVGATTHRIFVPIVSAR